MFRYLPEGWSIKWHRLWLSARSLFVAVIGGIVCIAAIVSGDRIVNVEHLEKLFGLPKDYLPIERKFVDEEEYSSAIALGDFVKENPDLPNAHAIVELRDQAEAAYNTWWSRTKRTVSGFFAGNTDSPQGMAGDFAANFLVYGNIRDLVKQGYNKATEESSGNLAESKTVFYGFANQIRPSNTAISREKMQLRDIVCKAGNRA